MDGETRCDGLGSQTASKRLAAISGSIEVNLAARTGRVINVDISSGRIFGVARLMVGRSADNVVELIGRLFSLCAAAQSVAAATAIETARGAEPDPRKARERVAAVVAERCIELLRGTLVTLTGADLTSQGPALRRIATALHQFDMRSPPQASAASVAIDGLEQELAALGIRPHCFTDEQSFERWLCGDSVIAELLRPICDGNDASFGAHNLEPLDAGADRMIGVSLRKHGATFAARPTLDGHIPETGALARNIRHPLVMALIERYGTGLLVRLLARLIEVSETPARLRAALVEQDDDSNGDVTRSYTMGPRTGLAAVECARGRLHHVVEIADDGTLDRLEVLAPTEWNFHPQGSLARALCDALIGVGEDAHARVGRLVAAFDPCVAFRVHIAEAGHA